MAIAQIIRAVALTLVFAPVSARGAPHDGFRHPIVANISIAASISVEADPPVFDAPPPTPSRASEEDVVRAMLALPQWVGDPADLAREAYYRPIARTIVQVTGGRRWRTARLIALAHHETKFATLVFTGRCSEMPKGQQCDGGRARGLFQLHRAACREAYALPAGTVESFAAEARCADKLLERAGSRVATDLKACGTAAVAAFTGYAARRCDWNGAADRVTSAAEIEERLWRR